MRSRTLRYTLLTIVTLMVIYSALGFGNRSFEAFCPFGGMESLWGLLTFGKFSCATGPLNLAMLVAVIVLTIIAKKTFCGWICPIGFIQELFGKLGKLIIPNRKPVSPRLNGYLKLFRYFGLALALYFTYHTGELVLRGYDPFYIIFSGFGHGTLGWISIVMLVLIFSGSLLIPMFFCRYLCPLGATLDPFSKIGLIKIARDEDVCIECGDCSSACPYDLKPNETLLLTHRDCTNCLECVDACPIEDCLTLKMRVKS